MGLAIARGIVEAHDGHIWIEDGAGGRGTRVTFTVPVGDEEPPPAGGSIAEESRASQPDELNVAATRQDG